MFLTPWEEVVKGAWRKPSAHRFRAAGFLYLLELIVLNASDSKKLPHEVFLLADTTDEMDHNKVSTTSTNIAFPSMWTTSSPSAVFKYPSRRPEFSVHRR